MGNLFQGGKGNGTKQLAAANATAIASEEVESKDGEQKGGFRFLGWRFGGSGEEAEEDSNATAAAAAAANSTSVAAANETAGEASAGEAAVAAVRQFGDMLGSVAPTLGKVKPSDPKPSDAERPSGVKLIVEQLNMTGLAGATNSTTVSDQVVKDITNMSAGEWW